MSQTQFVSYRGRGFWAYDVALAIFLKHLIDAADPLTRSSEYAWLDEAASAWRVVVGVGDYSLQIDETWSAAQLNVFRNLANEACRSIGAHDKFTDAEIAAWPPILDKERIFTRGVTEVSTVPIVELGTAIIALLDGSLPNSPAGTQWMYGTPDGRTALGTPDQLREIEQMFAFRYPRSFVSAFDEIVSLIGSQRFRSIFSAATLLTSVDEIKSASEGLPERLQPFLRVNEPQSVDIYAFDLEGEGREFPVVVWADHAIVKRWNQFSTFWRWVRELMKNTTTEQ